MYQQPASDMKHLIWLVGNAEACGIAPDYGPTFAMMPRKMTPNLHRHQRMNSLCAHELCISMQ